MLLLLSMLLLPLPLAFVLLLPSTLLSALLQCSIAVVVVFWYYVGVPGAPPEALRGPHRLLHLPSALVADPLLPGTPPVGREEGHPD